MLYFASYIVTDPGYAPLTKNQILSEKEYRELREKYEDDFDAGMGAEAVKKLLADINLEELSVQLREELQHASGQKKGPNCQAAGGSGRLPAVRQQAGVDDH